MRRWRNRLATAGVRLHICDYCWCSARRFTARAPSSPYLREAKLFRCDETRMRPKAVQYTAVPKNKLVQTSPIATEYIHTDSIVKFCLVAVRHPGAAPQQFRGANTSEQSSTLGSSSLRALFTDVSTSFHRRRARCRGKL